MAYTETRRSESNRNQGPYNAPDGRVQCGRTPEPGNPGRIPLVLRRPAPHDRGTDPAPPVSEPKNPPMSLAAPVTPAPPAAAPERVPPAFAAAWGALALGAGALVWVLSAVWAATPEMNDRFLIPLASAWLAYRLRPTCRATPARP